MAGALLSLPLRSLSGQSQAHAPTDPDSYSRQQVTDGTLKPGQPSPSITRLSQKHGHARPACGKALCRLEGEGTVTCFPGLGYHVN